MAVGFFGQFLLERGAIRSDQLMIALKKQASIRVPVAAGLLDRGVLSDAQVEELDRLGAGARSMETAIRRRMLDFSQVEEACGISDTRTDKRLFLAEALIRCGFLTLGQTRLQLAEHRRRTPTLAPEMDALFRHVVEKDIVVPFVSTTLDLFLKYTRQVLKVVSVTTGPVKGSGLAYGFSQRVKGDRNVEYILLLPEDLVHPVASHIVETNHGAIKVNMLDAVLEFVNVVVGNVCSELSTRRLSLAGDPPRLLTLDDVATTQPPPFVTVTLQAAKGSFQVLLRFISPPDQKGP